MRHQSLFGMSEDTTDTMYGLSPVTWGAAGTKLKLPSGRRHVAPRFRGLTLADRVAIAQVVAEIKATVAQWICPYSQCYVGISAQPSIRLSEGHNVKSDLDLFKVWPCLNSRVARTVEAQILELGVKGDTGGGDYDATFVYLYVMRWHTRE